MTPVENPQVTSTYGPRTNPLSGRQEHHNGEDMKDARGNKNLRAIWRTVKTEFVQSYNGGRGNTAYLYYSATLRVLYQHCASFSEAVLSKRQLKQGDLVGIMGNTGDSTGIHLHAEVQKLVNGKWTPVEPSKYTEVPNRIGVHPGNDRLDDSAEAEPAPQPGNWAIPVEGIDVSKHNGVVDWPKVAQAGKQFAMIRAGSWYTKTLTKDPCFESNYQGAKAVGMAVGCYFYSHSWTVDSIRREAAFFLDTIKDKQFDMPVCMDVEYEKEMLALSNEQRTEFVTVFLSILEDAGYYAALYASTDFIGRLLDYKELARFDVWAAQYGPTCTSKLPAGIWQHHGGKQANWPAGSCPGVTGACDLNTAFKDYPAIIRRLGLNGYGKADDKKLYVVFSGPMSREEAEVVESTTKALGRPVRIIDSREVDGEV